MTKNDTEAFKNSTMCWICNNVYDDVYDDVEVRDHCHNLENIEALHVEILISSLS